MEEEDVGEKLKEEWGRIKPTKWWVFVLLVIGIGALVLVAYGEGAKTCFNTCNIHFQEQFREHCYDPSYNPEPFIDFKIGELIKK